MRALALTMFVALAATSWSLPARAEGLRISTGFGAYRYVDSDGNPVNLFSSSVGARVSRGRAGLSFSVPMMGISGGTVTLSDENMAVKGGTDEGLRFGLGDMSVGLDYNLVQNREQMFFITLGGNLRFPTAAPALGAGEHLMGLSLSSFYGITRQLFAFAELRQAWVGVLVPTRGRTRSGELGAIYWLTQSLGVTASAVAASYGGRAPASLEFNLGLNVEILPGMMVNLGGLGGLFGGAPQAGGQFGFGFEL